MRSDLELTRQHANAASEEAKAAKWEVKRIKVDVEVQVAKEREEVEFDIYSVFLFIL